MKIILGATTVLLIAVFSVAYLYFSNLTVDSRSNDKTLTQIPVTASAVFQFTNDKSLFEIFRDYPLFDDITGLQKKEELSWLKRLLLTNQELYPATQGQKAFLSFHPAASESMEFLWLMPIKENSKIEDIYAILKRQAGNSAQLTDPPFKLLQIKNGILKRPFYLSVDRGIGRGSFSKELLLLSIDKKSKKISNEFIREINTSILKDENALANLFINHTSPGFLKPFFKQNPNGNFALFNNFSAYSSLNLNYKSDALMFNGVTKVNDKQGYINLFLSQKPVKNTLERIFPYNLSNSVSYGLSDYDLFHKNLGQLFESRKELKILNDQLALLTNETGVNPDRDIRKLWGNEFTTLQLSTYENLAVIKTSNGRQLEFFLEPLSSTYSDQVRKLNYANLFYYYFGDPLKKFTRPFYTVKDNLIIISNSPITVQHFLNDYNSERLLYKNESFIQFEQLIADQSNISFLIHFDNSTSLLESLLTQQYSNIFKSNNYGFKKFYGLSYQLTSNKNHFFTNFYIGNKYNAAVKLDSIVYTNDTILTEKE
jgi:hypothetical protein